MAITFKRRMADSLGDPATIIGQDIEIDGKLSGRGHFLILGTVIGDSVLDGPVTIAESARWEGALCAVDVVIDGEIIGAVVASGKIEIRPSARIFGTVTGASVAIAEGAIIEGEMKTSTDIDVQRFIEKRTKRKPAQRKKSADK
jgi:cytoskeletal protein CcmA (bactofilin family)